MSDKVIYYLSSPLFNWVMLCIFYKAAQIVSLNDVIKKNIVITRDLKYRYWFLASLMIVVPSFVIMDFFEHQFGSNMLHFCKAYMIMLIPTCAGIYKGLKQAAKMSNEEKDKHRSIINKPSSYNQM